MRDAIIYNKVRDFEQCGSSKKLSPNIMQLLKFINTKQQFSINDECFVQIRAESQPRLVHAIKTALKIGMIKPNKAEAMIPRWFEELNSVSYWQKQLRGSMFKNSDCKSGTTTRKTYLHMVWHFNSWLCKKDFELKKTVFVDTETFKQKLTSVRFSSIEELLLLLSEPFSPRMEIVKIIKMYLLDEIHNTKSRSYMIIIFSAIKS